MRTALPPIRGRAARGRKSRMGSGRAADAPLRRVGALGAAVPMPGELRHRAVADCRRALRGGVVVFRRAGSSGCGVRRERLVGHLRLLVFECSPGRTFGARKRNWQRKIATGTNSQFARSGLDNFAGIDRRSLPRTVRQTEIGLRAHLDQARGRALEFLRLEAFGRRRKARPAALAPTPTASPRGRRAYRSG